MATTPKGRARDEGAPAAVEEAPANVPASATVPAEAPTVETMQGVVVDAGTVRTSLPIGEDQIVTPDPGPLTGYVGTVGVPTAAPSGAPAGSTWTDDADAQPSNLNEIDGGPRLAYVVTWARAAVHVKVDAAQSRTVGTGDDEREEKYVTIGGPGGVSRDAVLEGQQVTLERGEVLPEEAAEGQGQMLLALGAVVAVSIPPAS